jgi:hypothetical protein
MKASWMSSRISHRVRGRRNEAFGGRGRSRGRPGSGRFWAFFGCPYVGTVDHRLGPVELVRGGVATGRPHAIGLVAASRSCRNRRGRCVGGECGHQPIERQLGEGESRQAPAGGGRHRYLEHPRRAGCPVQMDDHRAGVSAIGFDGDGESARVRVQRVPRQFPGAVSQGAPRCRVSGVSGVVG